MKNKLKRKGFTLIELIVVIAILGVLVLLSAPRFLGYTQKADEIKIQNDVKVVGNKIVGELSEDDGGVIGGEIIGTDKLVALTSEGKLYDYKGKVSELDEKTKSEEYYEVSDDIIKDSGTKLEGKFYSSSKGETYYENTKSLDKNEDVVVDPNQGVYLATDEDFSGTKNGNFKYIGKESEVRIPHTIKGVQVTSYARMFEGTSVTKVVSDNTNITDINYMFYLNKSSSLDLTGLDTSNVVIMSDTFSFGEATSVDLSNFDTSKVTNMDFMFHFSNIVNIDLSSFDISNVKNLDYMFPNARSTSGYARTQAEAVRLNKSSNKPSGLTFVVKP